MGRLGRSSSGPWVDWVGPVQVHWVDRVGPVQVHG